MLGPLLFILYASEMFELLSLLPLTLTWQGFMSGAIIGE